MSQFNRITLSLFTLVDGSSLAAFRIIFGVCLLWFTYFYYEENVVSYISRPGFHFTHFGFDWIRPWPGEGVYYHIVALRALAILITLGLFYRVSVLLFFLGFTYIFLLDSTINRNHPYLMCLVSFLLIFMPAHRTLSLDAFLKPRIRTGIAPRWSIWVLRLQFGVVYFYAGVAKVSYDWLHGEPIRGRLQSFGIGHFLATHEWALFVMCWTGMIFDLFVGFGLAFRKTRLFAWVVSVIFHVVNGQVWVIDMFPWMMIGCTLIFFDPDWPKQVYAYVKKRSLFAAPSYVPDINEIGTLRRSGAILLAFYCLVQILLPLRQFAYPGEVLWNTEGHRFAWRMMTLRTLTIAKFHATDPTTGETWQLNPMDFGVPYYRHLNPWFFPDNVLLFAHHAARELERQGRPNIEIRAEIYASMNSRKPQLLIDPTVDLTKIPRSLRHAEWVTDLTQPFSRTPAQRREAAALWESLGGDSREF